MFRRLSDTNLYECTVCGNSGVNWVRAPSYDRTPYKSDYENNSSGSYVCSDCHRHISRKSRKPRSQILMSTDLIDKPSSIYSTCHETNLEVSRPPKYTGRSHLKATFPLLAEHSDHSRAMSWDELTTSTDRHTLYPKNVVLEQSISIDHRCTQSEDNNQQLTQQVNSLHRVFNILEDRNQELKTQMNDLMAKNQQLQQQANNTDERCNQLEATDQNLTTQMTDLTASIDQLQQQANNTDQRCNQLEALNQSLSTQVTDLKRKNQQLQQQANNTDARCNQLEATNRNLTTQVTDLIANNEQLQQQANNTDQRCNQLEALNQCLSAQTTDLNVECKLLKADKETLHMQICDLNQQLQNHREQLTAIWIRINTAKEEPSLSPNIHIPTHVTDTRPPVISDIEVSEETTLLKVTPAWYEPIKPPTPDQIRFPTNYDKSSPTDVRKYQWLATYRTMMNKGQKVDFIAQPFESAAENTETVIVVLGELANQLGARLTFTDAKFDYSDSDYRMACGVGNLGSIHSMIASGDSVQTAKVKLHLNLDYHTVTASSVVVQKFVVDIINDISIILGCKKEFIRVFSITCASSIRVEIGLTTPEYEQTTAVAEQLKQELNLLSPQKRKGVLQYLVQERYTYKWEPVLSFLQLQPSDLDPQYNRYYGQAREERRGGRPYYYPEGWYRHALKVDNRYPGDTAWLGMTNTPGEWCVAYHGTKPGAVSDIIHLGLKHQFVNTDVCDREAKKQRPSIPDVKGLYVATHCEMGAADYSDWFPAEDSSGAAKKYKVVFQCRVQNDKFTEHGSVVRVGRAFRVFDEKAIRPYGILLKSE